MTQERRAALLQSWMVWSLLLPAVIAVAAGLSEIVVAVLLNERTLAILGIL